MSELRAPIYHSGSKIASIRFDGDICFRVVPRKTMATVSLHTPQGRIGLGWYQLPIAMDLAQTLNECPENPDMDGVLVDSVVAVVEMQGRTVAEIR